MSAAGEGVRLDFAGRPMARAKHEIEAAMIEYIQAFETAHKALCLMVTVWPRPQTITGDHRIPLGERDVVNAIVARASVALHRHQQLWYGIYQHQTELMRAVTMLPTEWSPQQTLHLYERPDLYGLDTEIVEDIESARARGAPWPTPLDNTNTAP